MKERHILPRCKIVVSKFLDSTTRVAVVVEHNIGSRCQFFPKHFQSRPFGAATFDGICNLGVTEHFSETELEEVLKEFHRLLRGGGKLLLLCSPPKNYRRFHRVWLEVAQRIHAALDKKRRGELDEPVYFELIPTRPSGWEGIGLRDWRIAACGGGLSRRIPSIMSSI